MNNVVDFAHETYATTAAAETTEQQTTTTEEPTLRDTVSQYLEGYIKDLGGEAPKNLYKVMLNLIEEPMLVGIMKYTRNNQSRAAKLLNISRGTLRKKLKIYDLL